MKFLHQDKSFIERRKELRSNMTPQEIIVWRYLKNSNLGFKFERQHGIGPYIVDFYCPEKKLIVEIDGSQHADNKEYDNERTLYIEGLGYKVIRFWNNEVNTNLAGVIQKILEEISPRPAKPGHPS